MPEYTKYFSFKIAIFTKILKNKKVGGIKFYNEIKVKVEIKK